MPVGWATLSWQEETKQQQQQQPETPVIKQAKTIQELLEEIIKSLPDLEDVTKTITEHGYKLLNYVPDELEYLAAVSDALETVKTEDLTPANVSKLVTSIAQTMVKSWLLRRKRQVINELAAVLKALAMCCGVEAVKDYIDSVASELASKRDKIEEWIRTRALELEKAAMNEQIYPSQEMKIFQKPFKKDNKIALAGLKIVLKRIPLSNAYILYLEPVVMPL